MLQYTGMWPRTPELEKVTFGFNLTKRQGDKLKDMLLAGKKVVMHGWVKGIGLEPYFMDVVVAKIPPVKNRMNNSCSVRTSIIRRIGEQ